MTLPPRRARRTLPARDPEPWNLNIHHDALLAALVVPGDRVIDVGCGDGFLSARLARRGCRVVALDADSDVLSRARARWEGLPVDWIHGDLLTHPLPDGVDAVVSNATLHHLPDTGAALARMGGLLRPGGRLGVVGFARNGPLDWPMSLAGAVAIAALTRSRPTWEHSAPIHWPPEVTYGDVRRISGHVLPGRTFRRLWLGRYLLTWTRPRGAGGSPPAPPSPTGVPMRDRIAHPPRGATP